MAYQDGDILVRAVMHNVTGIPADDIVNDFAFTASLEQDDAQWLNLVSRVDDFYNTAASNTVRVGSYMSDAINRAATHRMDGYRIVSGALGSPIFSTAWLGPATMVPGADRLPNEVAACLSFHADLDGVVEEEAGTSSIPSTEEAIDQGAPTTHPGHARPRARRRGRLYIGPLINNTILHTTPNPRMSDGFLLAMREGGVRLIDGNDDAGSGGSWGVWSRRDQQVHVITGGWTDDAIDTQRRRGVKAAARVLWGS